MRISINILWKELKKMDVLFIEQCLINKNNLSGASSEAADSYLRTIDDLTKAIKVLERYKDGQKAEV